MSAPAVHVTQRAVSPEESARRLRWAFAAAGLRFMRPVTRHHYLQVDRGKPGWGAVLEDLHRAGWRLQVLLSDPPAVTHLQAAREALEAGDPQVAYLNIQRLLAADDEDPDAQRLHLLAPPGGGGFGGLVVPRTDRVHEAARDVLRRHGLKVHAIGTVLRAEQPTP